MTGIFPPDIGGPATYIPKFAQFLVKNGYVVRVVTLANQIEYHRNLYSYDVISILRNRNRPKRILDTVSSIRKELASADFVFCNGLYYETAIALKFGGAKRVTKSVVKVVGNPSWERLKNRESRPGFSTNAFKKRMHNLFRSIEETLFIWSLRQFDEITSPGEDLANSLRSLEPRLDVSVIHNGVKKSGWSSESTKKYDLITVSRLVPWKNIEFVIDISRRLDCSLAIVGEGPDENRLRELSITNSKVEFLGKQSTDKVEVLLQEAKVFCQLSDYEGLSFSLLQAMSFGLPCIVSDIAANREVFRHDPKAAIQFQKSNIEDTVEEIRIILQSESVRKELGARAKQIAENFFDEGIQMKKMKELLISDA